MTSDLLEFSDLFYIDLKSNNPFDLFTEWHNEAKKFSIAPTGVVCLATVSRNSTPRSRHVFLQNYDENGFVFCTDSRGRKAQEIIENNHASMSIYWIYENDMNEHIKKQVRLEGTIENLPRDEVETFYNLQPFYAKIRAHLCHQDTAVEWHELKKRHDILVERAKIDNSLLQMPDYYIGCRLKPTWFDFYAAKDKFIADRIEFSKSVTENQWSPTRLAA